MIRGAVDPPDALPKYAAVRCPDGEDPFGEWFPSKGGPA